MPPKLRYCAPNYRGHALGTCLVHHRLRICYVNVPKSASTTVKVALLRLGFTTSSFLSHDYSDYFTFTVIREPVARFWSGFVEFWERERGDWRYDSNGERIRYWNIRSPEFLDLAKRPFDVFDEHLEVQCRFLDGLKFDQVCRCESLDSDIATLKARRPDLSFSLEAKNRFPGGDLAALFHDPVIEAEIRARYAEDLAAYADPTPMLKSITDS